MSIKIWLDDTRPAPAGWVRATTMAEAQDLMQRHQVEEMSLDHDLGLAPLCGICESRLLSDTETEDLADCRCSCHRELAPTGYDFVKWMLNTGKWPAKPPRVHSANPVGARNMLAIIEKFWFNTQVN